MLFRPTVFGYLFIWTCSASMLNSLQHKETVFLIRIFFLPLSSVFTEGDGIQSHANKWKQLLRMSPLQSSLAVEFLAAERMTVDCTVPLPCPPSVSAFVMMRACQQLSFYLQRGLLIFPLDHVFRGRIQLFWDHLAFSWDLSARTQEFHLPLVWWTGTAICSRSSMFFPRILNVLPPA